MAALNAQTAVQFQQYAAQQYPDSPEQQLILIRQLQEQHYQQYMQQLYQVQLAQQQVRACDSFSRSHPAFGIHDYILKIDTTYHSKFGLSMIKKRK